MFLDKKTSVLTCSGAKRLRRGSTIIRPLLNTHSDGTLVAGAHRYFLANFARWGKQFREFSTTKVEHWLILHMAVQGTCSFPC